MKKLFTALFVFALLVSYAPSRAQDITAAANDSTATAQPDYLMFAEQMPSFNGGDATAFLRWVAANVEYPLELMETRTGGTVVVSFIVDRDGRVTEIKELSSPDPRFTEAVKTVMEQSPRWEPGRQNDEPVRVMLTIPLKFDLSGLDDEALAEAMEERKKLKAYDGSGKKIVEVMPVFRHDGLQEFRSWVLSQIEYPQIAWQSNIEGDVVVSFIVERDGSIGEAKIISETSSILNKEVLGVLASCPKWRSPGYQDGNPVRVKFTMPVHFKIPADQRNSFRENGMFQSRGNQRFPQQPFPDR